MTQTAARTLWCAYGVIGPVGERARASLGDDLCLVGDSEAAVVVGQVPESEFAEEVLPAHLNDRGWLERAVGDHQSVMRRLLAVATVVPLRFGSLHRDTGAVEEFLAAHREEFLAALERVRGRVELGVKLWVADPADEAADERPATGREYLERRREARQRATAARASLDEALRAIHARLLATSEAGVLNRPQPRELTGDSRMMAMNAAYLVEAEGHSFRSEVERLRRSHPELVFEVTGPWAPYNFVGSPDA